MSNREKTIKLSQEQVRAFMQTTKQIIQAGSFLERALEVQDREMYLRHKTRWLEVLATFADHGEHLERKLHNVADGLFQVEEPPEWRNRLSQEAK
jgi:hypothetical protein